MKFMNNFVYRKTATREMPNFSPPAGPPAHVTKSAATSPILPPAAGTL
jgi:hypothetical protein